ncbi:unnamed protein product [Didymodactylos carnosus]|uniref:G-protein coupled receptors family 1 profile domain-containing protein n=1 Tax=Didymodactylos carnosus TaxID=1234261 RepID=A0A813V6U9_9BILA|nr:unnamed protein product [Didymodactylos carnosus]CAF1088681.1 unnamed protein product [Didymodactylos carnosus]CAF3620582.1 unnamed protein product [Didymodactylos carnosus]CAF3850380.1 unnamed protein product [Didymodactylos carnosus]
MNFSGISNGYNNDEFTTTLPFTITFSILLIIVLVIGIIGNSLVIYVVLNYGKLKTVTNTYLLHLAISDLIFLSGVPFLVAVMITKYWIFGYFLCKLFFLTQGVNQYTSIMILALLAFDSEIFRSSFKRVCCIKDSNDPDELTNKQNLLMNNLNKSKKIQIKLPTSLHNNNLIRRATKKSQCINLDPPDKQQPLRRNSSIFTSEKSICSEKSVCSET